MEKEEWKDIKGFEGIYMISNLGRVKSLSRKKRKNKNSKYFLTKEKILKPRPTRLGYQNIVLFKNSVRTSFAIHRLVAIEFIPNPEKKAEVNHINEVKDDNRASNLEWMTRIENLRHSISVKVYQYSQDKKLLKVWDNLTDTKKEGFNPCNVVDTCKGRQGHHRGFLWSYNRL